MNQVFQWWGYLAGRYGEDMHEIQEVEDGGVVELLEFLHAIYNGYVNNYELVSMFLGIAYYPHSSTRMIVRSCVPISPLG